MTKIMMAQANSNMHHSLGMSSDTLRQHDEEEALFLQEAAVSEDDGWDTRRLTRTQSIMHGHANVINTAKGRSKGSRSMSIDESMLPAIMQQELEQQTAAAALRLRTYKDRSFGDLTKCKDEGGSSSMSISTPTSPLRLNWGQRQGDMSSADSSPRGGGLGGTALPGN
jgi:hypothetical protein